MDEFARGGIFDSNGDRPVPLLRGCDYIIPKEYARQYGLELLKQINEGLDKSEEDGVE